jgi:hypothetical protein
MQIDGRTAPTMMETENYRENLEAVREVLRTADLNQVFEEIGRQGGDTINRFQVAHAPETSPAGRPAPE